MRPYSLDDAIKTFGKLLLQFSSPFLVRFKKDVQFPEENENTTDHRKPEGEGITSIYRPYRYVPWDGVWFLRFNSYIGYHFCTCCHCFLDVILRYGT